MTEKTAARRPRVLVGVDGSAPARAALEFAVGEARMRDAVVVAVMAVQLPDYEWIDPYAMRIPEEGTLQRAREKLDQLLASVNTDSLAHRTRHAWLHSSWLHAMQSHSVWWWSCMPRPPRLSSAN